MLELQQSFKPYKTKPLRRLFRASCSLASPGEPRASEAVALQRHFFAGSANMNHAEDARGLRTRTGAARSKLRR